MPDRQVKLKRESLISLIGPLQDSKSEVLLGHKYPLAMFLIPKAEQAGKAVSAVALGLAVLVAV